MGRRCDDEGAGVFLESYEAAFAELRARASSMIARAEHLNEDGRRKRVRLRDERGELLFEGTMEEATRAYPALDAEGKLVAVHALQ